jgi:hypothetical protein
MLVYLPCMNVFRADDSMLTDLDVAVVADGRFVLGEVKTDPSSFKPEDFEKLLIVARKALPDLVMVAALGTTWPGPVIAEIASLEAKLRPLGVAVRKHQIGEYVSELSR